MLNLQKNADGLLECRGRVQGLYPIYLPTESLFTEKLVMHCHKVTLHGGVIQTMTQVRENYWIPRLRQLVKRLRFSCRGCKKFHAIAFNSPPPGYLPKDRTEGRRPFDVIGVDYAGPIACKENQRSTRKAYILLFTCSLSRAVYIELTKDMTTEQFMPCLKALIARRGRPSKIYSDNAKTFIAASKAIEKIMRSEELHNYLAKNKIRWQFNLSKAPWWGGQYERIVGLVKQALFKVVGAASLKFQELREILLDVEISLNNRPLSYVEEDIQFPTLTPNIMLMGQNNALLEEDVASIEDKDLRNRAKYLERCKDNLWKRWTAEYLKGLRERHNLKHGGKEVNINIGDVVLIKGEEKNRGCWSIGIVKELIKGTDGVIRAARLKAKKSILERAVQQLHPLELSCDKEMERVKDVLDPKAREFRPKRNAARDAEQTIKEVLADEERGLADD